MMFQPKPIGVVDVVRAGFKILNRYLGALFVPAIFVSLLGVFRFSGPQSSLPRLFNLVSIKYSLGSILGGILVFTVGRTVILGMHGYLDGLQTGKGISAREHGSSHPTAPDRRPRQVWSFCLPLERWSGCPCSSYPWRLHRFFARRFSTPSCWRLCSLVTLSPAGFCWGLANAVTAREDITGIQALKRSWNLVYGVSESEVELPVWRRFLSVNIVLYLLVFILSGLIILPFLGDPEKASFALLLAEVGTISALSAIQWSALVLLLVLGPLFTALTVCCYYAFYIDVVVRKEGYTARSEWWARPYEAAVPPAESPHLIASRFPSTRVPVQHLLSCFPWSRKAFVIDEEDSNSRRAFHSAVYCS
jgi:hypothetical protein